MTTLRIEGQALGSKRRLFNDFSVPVSPAADLDGGIRLRDLIILTVRQQVAAFEARQTERQFLRVLTERDISDGMRAGKIDSGGVELEPKAVDVEAAIETALLGFIDGLYLVAIDGEEKKDLDETIFLHAQSRMTFIRLTLLSG